MSKIGNDFEVGERYGKLKSNLIRGFLSQEINLVSREIPNYRSFLARCKPFIQKHTPRAFNFFNGIAKSTKIDIDDLLALSLHEEYFHLSFSKFMTHCSLIVAKNESGVMIGQNWDWPCRYAPWGKVERLKFSDNFSLLSYNYPGLPACITMNSDGLALAWTGAGYFPPVLPRPGVPTYLALFEVSLCKTVVEGHKLIKKIPFSGASILVIADRINNSARIYEILPQLIEYSDIKDVIARANHFQFTGTIKASKQTTWNETKSGRRIESFKRWTSGDGKIDLSRIKRQLLHPEIFIDNGLSAMTVHSFVLNTENKSFHIRDGGTEVGQLWRVIKV